eukprot:m.18219 g.18219  ORF g.18219 m.18219 type:complete len:179 (-) comp10773_c0_seq1:189-725(-)
MVVTSMAPELIAATNGILRLLQRDIPESSTSIFRQALQTALEQRVKPHWFVDQPHRAQALRCVAHTARRPDKAILAACAAANVTLSNKSPKSFVVYIDPSSVSVRLGAHTIVPLDIANCDFQELETTLAETRTSSPSYLTSVLSSPDTSPRLSASSPKFSRSKQPLAIIDPVTLQAHA